MAETTPRLKIAWAWGESGLSTRSTGPVDGNRYAPFVVMAQEPDCPGNDSVADKLNSSVSPLFVTAELKLVSPYPVRHNKNLSGSQQFTPFPVGNITDWVAE